MNWLSRIFRVLSPTCQQAVRLQSEALDRPLPRLQRLGLRIHLVLCSWCARYGKQIQFLRAAAQRREHEDSAPGSTLSAEARERIKRALESTKT